MNDVGTCIEIINSYSYYTKPILVCILLVLRVLVLRSTIVVIISYPVGSNGFIIIRSKHIYIYKVSCGGPTHSHTEIILELPSSLPGTLQHWFLVQPLGRATIDVTRPLAAPHICHNNLIRPNASMKQQFLQASENHLRHTIHHRHCAALTPKSTPCGLSLCQALTIQVIDTMK